MLKPTHASRLASRAASAALIAAIFMVPAFAQDSSAPPALVPGMRVRIVAPDNTPKKVMGTIRAVDAESVSLEVPGRADPVSIERSGIASLEVSEGPRSRWVDAAIGAGAGAVAGVAGGALAGDSQKTQLVSSGAVAGLCSLIGAGIGALIGAAIPPGEHWRHMQAAGYRWSIVPRMDRDMGFSVSLGF